MSKKQGPQYVVAYNSNEGEWYTMDDIRSKVEDGKWTRDLVHQMTWVCPVEHCRKGVMTPRMGAIMTWHFARTDYGHVDGCDLENNPPGPDFVRRKRSRAFDPTPRRPIMDVSALLREPKPPKSTRGAAVTINPAGEKPPATPGTGRSWQQAAGDMPTIPHSVRELMQWIQYQRQHGIRWQTQPIACQGNHELQTMGDLVFTDETPPEVMLSIPDGSVRYHFGEVGGVRHEPRRGRYPAAIRVALKRWTNRTTSVYVYVHERYLEVIKTGAIVAVRAEKIKQTGDRGVVLLRAAQGKDLREDFVELYRIETRDKHIVRSSHEQMIDDWLYQHGIDHDVPGPLSVRCPIWKCAEAFNHGDGYYVPDFVLYLPRGPVIVEHYGFGGTWAPGREYQQNRARKESFYRDLAECGEFRYEAIQPPEEGTLWDGMLMERLGKYIGEEPPPEPEPIRVPPQPEAETVVAPPHEVVVVKAQPIADPTVRIPPVTTKEQGTFGMIAGAIMDGLRGLFGRKR